jgi:hypothetical protein
MANYTTYLTGNEKLRKCHQVGRNLYLYELRVSFATQNLDAGDGDVQQALQLPAGTIILGCWLNVITAETANGTCDLGYGGSVNFWGDALALDATGPIASTSAGNILVLSSADTIDIKATTDTADVDLDGGVVDLYALVMRTLP